MAAGGRWVVRNAPRAWNAVKNVPNAIRNLSKYSRLAIEATKNSKSKDLVLGKFNKSGISYDLIAKDMNVTYFHLKNWEKVIREVGSNNIWKINKQFLVQQIYKGKNIFLSHNPEKATGFFKMEVQFLIKNGFRFIKDGSLWKAVKK